MNDAHIYCTKEQISKEIEDVISMIKDYYKIFGLKDYYFRLSLWSPENKTKYIYLFGLFTGFLLWEIQAGFGWLESHQRARCLLRVDS